LCHNSLADMNFPPISALFFFCGVLSAALAAYAWLHRSTIATRSFAFFSIAVATYAFGYGMELASPSLAVALFWSKVQYLGILAFPTLYLVFVIQYIGRGSWLTPRNLALLFTFPVFFLIMKLFDDSLHWIYATANAEIIDSVFFLTFSRGGLYIPLAIYQLLVVTIANVLLVQKWRFSAQLFRTQTGILLWGAVIPYLTYLVYLMGVQISPLLKGIDINPLSYAIWVGIVALAIFRYRLLELAPIARDALIERLADAVVVLDTQSRVVDANPEALKTFDWLKVPLGEMVSATPILGKWIDPTSLATIETSTKKEISLPVQDDILYYELSASVLKERNGEKIGYLIVSHDISGQKKIENRLQELSLTDELTGLNNRRGFSVLADQLIGMANRLRMNLVLFYVDLDGLKQINDALGHAAGDQALKEAASILKASFRVTDIIARLGGDEFVILAAESKENSTIMMLERLQVKIDTQVPLSAGHKISMSIGQAHYDWKKPIPIADLIKESDRSMYEVKKGKRG
jgi:diguanylate cyclase (GGDEF)-like protein